MHRQKETLAPDERCKRLFYKVAAKYLKNRARIVYTAFYKRKPLHLQGFSSYGGGGRIRTIEVTDNRFTAFTAACYLVFISIR